MEAKISGMEYRSKQAALVSDKKTNQVEMDSTKKIFQSVESIYNSTNKTLEETHQSAKQIYHNDIKTLEETHQSAKQTYKKDIKTLEEKFKSDSNTYEIAKRNLKSRMDNFNCDLKLLKAERGYEIKLAELKKEDCEQLLAQMKPLQQQMMVAKISALEYRSKQAALVSNKKNKKVEMDSTTKIFQSVESIYNSTKEALKQTYQSAKETYKRDIKTLEQTNQSAKQTYKRDIKTLQEKFECDRNTYRTAKRSLQCEIDNINIDLKLLKAERGYEIKLAELKKEDCEQLLAQMKPLQQQMMVAKISGLKYRSKQATLVSNKKNKKVEMDSTTKIFQSVESIYNSTKEALKQTYQSAKETYKRDIKTLEQTYKRDIKTLEQTYQSAKQTYKRDIKTLQEKFECDRNTYRTAKRSLQCEIDNINVDLKLLEAERGYEIKLAELKAKYGRGGTPPPTPPGDGDNERDEAMDILPQREKEGEDDNDPDEGASQTQGRPKSKRNKKSKYGVCALLRS
ncbi:uncharacterized protein [Nerophis lumbriciformis]|uniref:uncharacterized protein isoform X2 n=1 Tax=Nerophis lumbriciformis TaxID=546530 RepID=UPI002ADFD4FE|nr:uncharacterized protein LOC133620521 isoform X2 [Nerophis lumbriciformis]